MEPQPAQRPADWLVLGGDVGGTSTRILVAASDGTPVGRGAAGGGNPVSHPDTAAAALGQALTAALAGIDPSRVRAGVVGVAGGSALSRPEVRAAFERVWSETEVGCAPAYVSDLEIAFAAGTGEPDGTVLIAGTGAVAGEVESRSLVRTVDGHGWLLGDNGSGFWLGREAARATLRTLDAGEPLGPLASSVLRALEGPDGPRTPAQPTDPYWQRVHLIESLNSRPPVRLAELAPSVTAAYKVGDPQARWIVGEAARLLFETVCRVRRADEQTPIVLAGSVAGEGTPVGVALRTLVSEGLSGPTLSARDGVAGAAWLALAAAETNTATEEARNRLSAV